MNVMVRFKLYDYAEDGRDFETEVIEAMQIEPSDNVLDVGCSHGMTLVKMRDHSPEAGLTGVDLFTSAFTPALAASRQTERKPINFMVGTAESLPVADDSFDKLTALFMLYHVADIDASLREMQRVVKTGGSVVIATSGAQNKLKHRQMEADIAAFTDTQRPNRFSQTFDAEVAQKLLPEYFSDIQHSPHQTRMVITEDRVGDYYYSLVSMLEDFQPAVRGLQRVAAMQRCVTQPVHAAIEQDGAFYDTIDRHFFICRND
ncbi:methyltransferase domain-containing protein [Candidatus Saccharibacteria bacterium]|nr:methyltransferase domain-containing protein [Candidatus Saccharibacteria bacterium]